MLDQVSKQTLLDFLEVFKGGADENNIRKFFEGLNQYQNLLHFLEISTSNIDRIYSSIHRLSNKVDNHIGSGCKLTGVGKGGEVMFALPYGCYREDLPELIKKIPGSSLDYTSWDGGIESEAVKFEQDFSKNLISDFSKKAKALVRVYSKNTTNSFLLFDDGEIDADLVLDEVKGKILYKSKPVVSKTIPSQKATVEIVSELLKAEDFQLKNTSLGKYGKSRYDLQGKITTPLTKLTGINFEISGGVYDDFTLKLKSFDLTIAVVSAI
jgi:hypothetical protein